MNNISEKGIMEPKEVLMAFMSEMQKIEMEANKKYKKIIVGRQYKEDPAILHEYFNDKVKQIYQKYCSLKNIKKARLQEFGDPTIYDPKKEKIVEITNKTTQKVIIITERILLNIIIKYKYTIIKEQGNWRIDSKMAIYDDRKPIKGLL